MSRDCRYPKIRPGDRVAVVVPPGRPAEGRLRPPDPEEIELIPITAEWRWNSDFALIPAG
jgi:hypothetical protein